MTSIALPTSQRTAVRIGGREYPVVFPTLRDPRLHLAAVIVSLQVLGQTVLGFELSIAQILASIITCAVLEVGLRLWRRRILMWPASAMLTGNGVAFILRVPGTRHGDWWSLQGVGIFAAAAAVSLLSKYVIRTGGQHLFNPSNFGLVAVFLVLGTRAVNPQDLWWGPMSPGLLLTLGIIVTGGLVIVRRLDMLGLTVGFWLTFAAASALIAASGHCMTARWHVGPVCGGSLWEVLALSPEILVFMFFMITDPKTTPAGRLARVVYGAGVAFAAALLIAPVRSEFSTKVGILAALVAVCAARPLLERFLPAAGSERERTGAWVGQLSRGRRILAAALAAGVAVAGGGLLVAAGVRARPAVTGEAVRAGSATPRPPLSLPATALPAVTVDPSVHRIAASITAPIAQKMARDVVSDLAIAGDALRNRDGRLASTAASGAWLRAIEQQIDAAGNGGPVVVPGYRFDRMSVVAVTDPLRPQDPARIGIAVHGTVHRVTYAGPAADPGVAQSDSAFDRRFVVARSGDHYLITAEVKAP